MCVFFDVLVQLPHLILHAATAAAGDICDVAVLGSPVQSPHGNAEILCGIMAAQEPSCNIHLCILLLRICPCVSSIACIISHKYSLVTNLLALTEYLEDNPIGRLSLNYDFSIIHYNLEEYRMDREVNLTFFKDGQGLFDLNVEGKEEKATLDYAKWNLLLSE